MQVMIVTLVTSYCPWVFPGSCWVFYGSCYMWQWPSLNDWCKLAPNIVTSNTASIIPYKTAYANIIVCY
jgi:hypothetical protein